jgi:hypothetical protein
MQKKERRLENRFLCADLVRVDWVPGAGEATTVEAVLEDISPVGACVQVEEAIPLGAAVAITAHGNTFNGFVSYCVFRDYGYFVGVKLSDQSRWSRVEFEPQHLTNLRELALKKPDSPPRMKPAAPVKSTAGH